MAPRTLPGLGLKGFAPSHEDDWDAWTNINWRIVSALLQGAVISAVTNLPGSPNNGDIYIVPSGGHATEIAVRDNGAWVYIVPAAGWRMFATDNGGMYVFDGDDWSAGIASLVEESQSATAPQLELRKKGSPAGIASPSAALSSLGAFVSSGWTGSAFKVGGKMLVQTEELWSGTVAGTSFLWQVIAAGANTLVDRLQLTATALLPAQEDLVVALGSFAARWSKLWAGNVSLFPGIGTSQTPANNGELTFETTSNTSVKIVLRGSDGTVRKSASIDLS